MYLTWDIKVGENKIEPAKLGKDMHGNAKVDWGIFNFFISYGFAQYNDGTKPYHVYFGCPAAKENPIVLLTDTRGYLLDAINATEALLFSKPYQLQTAQERVAEIRLNSKNEPGYHGQVLSEILSKHLKRDEMTQEQEIVYVDCLFSMYEKYGFAEAYHAEYPDETKQYDGMKFKVLGRCRVGEQPLRHLPMWHIEMENGTIFDAIPEEICTLMRGKITWFEKSQICSTIQDAFTKLSAAGYTLKVNVMKAEADRTSGCFVSYKLADIMDSFGPDTSYERLLEYLLNAFDRGGCAEIVTGDSENTYCVYHVSDFEEYVTKQIFDLIETVDKTEPLKAVDIQWDVDDEEDLENLPTEMDIPIRVIIEIANNNDAVSDYISETTGFCHAGFRLVDTDGNEVDMDG